MNVIMIVAAILGSRMWELCIVKIISALPTHVAPSAARTLHIAFSHTCLEVNCTVIAETLGAYCARHTCSTTNCAEPRLGNPNFCDLHQCQYSGSRCTRESSLGTGLCATHSRSTGTNASNTAGRSYQASTNLPTRGMSNNASTPSNTAGSFYQASTTLPRRGSSNEASSAPRDAGNSGIGQNQDRRSTSRHDRLDDRSVSPWSPSQAYMYFSPPR
jgi:hypothetical protein